MRNQVTMKLHQGSPNGTPSSGALVRSYEVFNHASAYNTSGFTSNSLASSAGLRNKDGVPPDEASAITFDETGLEFRV